MLVTNALRKLWNDQRGQDSVEFALVGASLASAALSISPAVFTTVLYVMRVMHVLDVVLGVTVR